MISRCYSRKAISYKYYGARGIKVCKRWHSFDAFLVDMGEPPLGRTLDRVNNDGNYTPRNCRWATPSEQGLNRRPRKRKAMSRAPKAIKNQAAKNRKPTRRTIYINIPVDLAERIDAEAGQLGYPWTMSSLITITLAKRFPAPTTPASEPTEGETP